jgi:hypothetical protein
MATEKSASEKSSESGVSSATRKHVLDLFRQWVAALDQNKTSTTDEKTYQHWQKQLTRLQKALISTLPPTELEAFLVAEQVITIDNDCTRCKGCWIVTEKGKTLPLSS